MSKPEDISQEVWEKAREAIEPWLGPTNQYRHDCQEDIARAILAAEKRGEDREREACADTCDRLAGTDGFDTSTGQALAQEIRARAGRQALSGAQQ